MNLNQISQLTAGICLTILLLFSCSKGNNNPQPTKADTKLTITSISIDSGVFTTRVIITGTGFSSTPSDNKVFFNGIAANKVIDGNSTSLQTFVPLGAGTGPVTVTLNGTTVTGPVFTYHTTEVKTSLAGGGPDFFDDGQGAAAAFFQPDGLTIDDAGNLYVADVLNNRIRKVTPNGLVTTFAGNGKGTDVDGDAKTSSFHAPQDICIDKAGNLYVTEKSDYLRKITPDGNVTTLVRGDLLSDNKLNNPMGIAVDAAGNLYVANQGDGTIKKVSPTGAVTTISDLTSKGMATQALTIDKSGNLYFLSNNGVAEQKTDGTIVFIAGGNNSDRDGTGSEAGFNPWSITMNNDGNIIVGDLGNNRIRLVTPAGVVTTIAGKNQFSGVSGPDGPAQELYADPMGIVVGKTGIIYFVEQNLIKKISVQ